MYNSKEKQESKSCRKEIIHQITRRPCSKRAGDSSSQTRIKVVRSCHFSSISPWTPKLKASLYTVSLISFQAFRNLPSAAVSILPESMPLRSHHCSRYCSIASRLDAFEDWAPLEAAGGLGTGLLPLSSPSVLIGFGSGVGESLLFRAGVSDLSLATRCPFIHS
jgi:hypothetical protein